MNLLYFKFSNGTKHIYLNNVDIIAFLNFWHPLSNIEIESFYAYAGEQYHDTDNVSGLHTIEQLVDYIGKYNNLMINDVSFTCGNYRIEIHDMYEYIIYSGKAELQQLFNYLLTELLLINSISTKVEISKLEEMYVLIDNDKIKNKFHSFDDYLAFIESI